ncbi:MAG TPA: UDP-N-acetylmuramoyl-L-alanine--D-glutamate ligase [Candidatus Binataceae bacterium]
MTLAELARARVLVLGLGREGLETYRFLRAEFPGRIIGLADRLPIERLAPAVQRDIAADRALTTHFGDGYLASLGGYDVVVRSPGVPLITPAIGQAARAGVRITSHIEIFLANCTGTTIGVTGTKGKSTTASLIHAILRAGGLDAHLVGNIGVPPLSLLRTTGARSYLVIELSSYQLDGIGRSPHVAVLLNIVPEHLDLHGGFENYVHAKQNITRFQSAADILIYNAMYPIPRAIADASRARRLGFSIEGKPSPGSFLKSGNVVYRGEQGGAEVILPAGEVPLAGRFNLQNVLAAVTVGRELGVDRATVARSVRAFKPLPYRLERVGTFGGIVFYNDPLATIPEATIAGLDALGHGVATILLGGYDRGLDMDGLARRLRHSEVSTVILFPPSGARIWAALEREYRGEDSLPKAFFTGDMRTAVSLAGQNTPQGRICLHSPASPSFGLFKDYMERGDLFRRYVRELGSEDA